MSTATYFDTRAELMATNRETGVSAMCYDQQVALLESLIRPGMTVLDVGCGPELPYRAPHAYVIGLDPSKASLAANRDIDASIVGSAERISLDDASVDLVVAFYALHHVTAATSNLTSHRRFMSMKEMWRVLRPGGEMLVFEVSPLPWAATVQRWLWPAAKWLLGQHLDAYFWTVEQIQAGLPHSSRTQTFDCSPFAMFPPVLSLPWLKIPRFLYPFSPTLVRWCREF